jgi:hypothetical protein
MGQDGLIMRLVDLDNDSLIQMPFISGLIGSSIRIP